MDNKNIAVKVENISKCYRIGVKRDAHDNFASAIVSFVKSPLDNYRKYRSLYKFDNFNTSSSGSNSPDLIWALRDVSFEVEQGEVLGIIGPNGAGKSTLLKILSKITDPTSGRAEIRGKVSSLLEVGTGFNPELTGRENVYLNSTILGMKKVDVDRKFDKIVDFSGVEKFIDTPVKRYSSGMRVRLAFAVAAHLEPEILIIDEVLAVGDAEFQKKCLGIMGDIAKGGRTVLFVSHNLAAVSNLCKKVILIRDGTVCLNGETNQVIESYLENINEQTDIQLSDREDREGSGKIKVMAVEFLNHKGYAIQYPISGQEIIIRLHYKCFEDNVFTSCLAIVAISHNSQHLFRLSTDLGGTSQLNISGEGYIDFMIPALPLRQNTYHLSFVIKSNGVIHDKLSYGLKMVVHNGDFYGTGRSYNRRDGTGVLVKHSWIQGK